MIGRFPDAVTKVRFKVSDQTVAEINPIAGLLKSAINLIPDRGFMGNAKEQRAALFGFIKRIEDLMNSKSYLLLQEAIRNEFIPMARQVIKPSFQKLEPRDFDQKDIIDVANSLAARSRALKDSTGFTDNGFVEVRPEKTTLLAGESLRLSVDTIASPVSPNTEYDVTVTLAGGAQRIRKTSTASWFCETRGVTESDSSAIVASYQYDARKDKEYVRSIERYRSEIISLEALLEDETDASKIALLKREIGEKKSKINSIIQLRSKLRIQVGLPLEVQFEVN